MEERKEKILGYLNFFKTKGLSHDKNLTDIIKYQDLIGHSTPKDLEVIYNGFNQQEKELFVWVNSHTLSFDMFIDIIKGTVIKSFKHSIYIEAEDYLDEQLKGINKRIEQINNQEKAITECRKPIHKRIKKLTTENKELAEEIVYLKQIIIHKDKQLANNHKRDIDYKRNMIRINKFSTALSTINVICEEIKNETRDN